MSWITESNRQKHFLYAIPCAFLLTIYSWVDWLVAWSLRTELMVVKWDWLDLLATILGGIVGQMLQVLLIYILKCVC